ncbi:MAG: alpha-galactosidase [Spirochaetaceae bacterium]|nr:MAG: alpha-galactosidase [Spirochaetaceae bacterium]
MSVKIAFIGAGSIVFTRNLLSDIYLYPELKDSTIALMDVDQERLDMAKMVAEELKVERGCGAAIEAHLRLEEALRGADYVVNVVQIGGKESTRIDFDIPEKYGLKQTIADTHGICGMMRFLRTVPHLENLCRCMQELCPNAYLLNFTNPMSMCQWYIHSISDLQTIGLCHSVPGTIEELARYVEVPVEEINFLVAGINHMAWVLRFERKGNDLYPKLYQAMDDPEIWKWDPVRFEIMRHFSYFVTESSEHMAEYVPYFIKDEETIRRLNIPIREYVSRVELNERAFEAERAYYLKGKEEMKGVAGKMTREYYRAQGKPDFDEIDEEESASQSREYAVQIIHALESGIPTTVYGIGPNKGTIASLPNDCMVDTPRYVDRSGVHPLVVGELPPQLAALILPQINMQRLAVKAALTREAKYIHYASLIDPLASSVLGMDQIHDLTEELMNAHRSYLPDFH